ncbi:MAG: hypothetical protein KJI69_03710 [Patescibacteria group bacterium]|nr:hypothetical protein [Patescibacteria group bacterium]
MKGFKDSNNKFHPIQRYKKVRKALDPIRTLKKTKGVKMTSFQARPTSQFATTLKKDERTREGIKVTAEWEDFIRENYPKGKWSKPTGYFRIRKNDDGMPTIILRPRQLERITIGDKSKTRFHPQMIEQREEVPKEVKDAWNLMQTFDPKSEKSRIEDFLKKWTQMEADDSKRSYLKYGRFSDNKVVKVKDGYAVSDLLSPLNQFIQDVEEGKITDKNGLKLSTAQVQGLRPEGGFLNAVLGKTFGVEQRDDAKASGYYAGLVVKIASEDPELSDFHNTWGVIKQVIDDYHYEVIPEDGSAKDGFIIRDEDVKGLVGDKDTDLIGIGEERHKEEVIPIIEKAMKGE